MTPSLPHWPEGSAGVLCACGPHAIPVSTAVRAGERRLLFALGGRRDALARLREYPRAAFCLMSEGVAFTARGRAAVVREPMEAGPMVAVALEVEHVQDHLADGRTELLAPPSWRWRSHQAEETDRRVRTELAALAARPPRGGSA